MIALKVSDPPEKHEHHQCRMVFVQGGGVHARAAPRGTRRSSEAP